MLIQLGKIVIRSESQSVVSFTPLETKSLPEPHWDSLDTQIPVSSLVTSTDTRKSSREFREICIAVLAATWG